MKSVGVDIGATAVRVVEIDQIDQGFARLSAVAVAPLPLGAVVHGTIANRDAVTASLDVALKRAKVRRHGLVMTVGSPDCALTSRTTPAKVSPLDREGILRNDTTPLSSRYSVDELAVSSYIADSDGTTDDCVVAVANNRIVDDYVKVCTELKIVPRALDLNAASLARAAVRTAIGDNDTHTLVDIGASKTTIATRRGLNLRHVRTIEGGGNDVTQAVAAMTGEDWIEAERRKRSLKMVTTPGGVSGILVTGGYGQREELLDDAPLATAAEEAYTNAIEQLVEQIALSIEALRRTGDFPGTVTLYGGGCSADGLVVRLYQRLGLPVSIGRPWAELGKSKQLSPYLGLDANASSELLLSLTPAIGAALWKEAS